MIKITHWLGLMALTAAPLCGAQTIIATPSSGSLGTLVTVESTDTSDPRFGFDASTRLVWVGRYHPPAGNPTDEVAIVVDASDLVLVDPWTVRFPVGAGQMSPTLDLDQLLGFGSFVGTITAITGNPCSADFNGDGVVNGDDLGILLLAWGDCPAPPSACPADLSGNGIVNGDDLGLLLLEWGACQIEIQAAFNFGIESNAARWEYVMYPEGLGGIVSPELDGEIDELPMYLLSLAPDPVNPAMNQFIAAADNHIAATLRIVKNADSIVAAPSTILADIVSFDDQGVEVDRREVPLLLDANADDPDWLIYTNNLNVPILLVDVPVNIAAFPEFVLVRGVIGGTATIVPRHN